MIPPRALRLTVAALLSTAVLALPACAPSGQSRYNYDEVGRAVLVEFGTIVTSRPVDITGRNTGAGATLGATSGGLIGSAIGRGGGNAAAIIGGVVIGAVAGAVAEQAMANRVGLEYTILLRNDKVVTIVQEQQTGDRLFRAGERVMVQVSGGHQRVLGTEAVPTEMARPKGILIHD
jgi:outer membrane lipoprotein SlyB